MADLDTVEETGSRGAALERTQVLIGIPSPVSAALLRERTEQTVQSLHSNSAALRFAVAYPGTQGAGNLSSSASNGGDEPEWNNAEREPQMIEYSLSHGSSPAAPWLGLSAAYGRLAAIAKRIHAGAVVIISPDLAALDARSVQALLEPVLDRRADVAMPLYTPGKFEGLLNSSILYPFSRALYGRRVRYPLGPDFGVSTPLLEKMGVRSARPGDTEEEQSVVWPANEVAIANSNISQVYLDGHHGAQNEGLDLSMVLGLLAGSLFAGAERNAMLWQRVRGSQPGLTLGAPAEAVDDGRVDVRPMLEAFHLASRNLQEVWALVLPPVTLLEIKRLGRLTAEQFRIADGLWARIIYDFALAHRLRTLSRTHLLGALTPLYLGWVASYAQEIADADAIAAEQRIERLAKTFEDEKAYFVSRWRWPDRFNP